MEEITTPEEMSAWIAAPEPGLLFKYSPTCGISQVAQEAWDEFARRSPGLRLAQCDVLAARPAARGMVEQVGVAHQSPQILVLRQGTCLAHTSHYSITTAWLEQARAKWLAG